MDGAEGDVYGGGWGELEGYSVDGEYCRGLSGDETVHSRIAV